MLLLIVNGCSVKRNLQFVHTTSLHLRAKYEFYKCDGKTQSPFLFSFAYIHNENMSLVMI